MHPPETLGASPLFQREMDLYLSLILPAPYQQLFLPALYLCSLRQCTCATIDYPKPQLSLSEGFAGSVVWNPFCTAALLQCFFMPLHLFFCYVLSWIPFPNPSFLTWLNTSLPLWFPFSHINDKLSLIFTPILTIIPCQTHSPYSSSLFNVKM